MTLLQSSHTPSSSTTPIPLKLRRTVTRLPWLDGNSLSHGLPGSFQSDALDHEPPIVDPLDKQEMQQIRGRQSLQSKPSDNSISQALPISMAPPFSASTETPLPGGYYTPSMYSRKGTETDSRTSFLRKDPASYEKLVTRSSTSLPPSKPIDSCNPPSAFSFGPDLAEEGDIGLIPIHKQQSMTDGNFSSVAPSEQHDSPRIRAKCPTTRGTAQDESSMSGPPSRGHQLGGAVSNLQRLMSEALQIIEDAALTGRDEEVASILEDAAVVNRNANQITGQMHEPLRLSEIELSSHSEHSSSDTSYAQSLYAESMNILSDDTRPTEWSNSFSSPAMSSQEVNGKGSKQRENALGPTPPASPRTTPSQDANLKSVSDLRLQPARTQPKSTLGLPEGLKRRQQEPSADSIAIDFAYAKPSMKQAIPVSAPMKSDKPLPDLPFLLKTSRSTPAKVSEAKKATALAERTRTQRHRPNLTLLDPIPIAEPKNAERISGVTYASGPKRRQSTKRSAGPRGYPNNPASSVGAHRGSLNHPPYNSHSLDTGGPETIEEADESQSKRPKYRRRGIARE